MPAPAPNQLFFGTLPSAERNYVTSLYERVLSRYPRVVEPACGPMTMATIAAGKGIPPAQIATSDVSLFSALIGCCITDTPLESLGLVVDGSPFAGSGDLTADTTALIYRILLAKHLHAKSDYAKEMLIDVQRRRADHEATIREALDALRERLQGVTFRAYDLFAHVRDARDDPEAFIFIAPPTVRSDYEKMFDTDGTIAWAQPPYELYDPKTGNELLYELTKDSPALVVGYREALPSAGTPPVFLRDAGKGKTFMLWSNRPDEAESIMGRCIKPLSSFGIAPLKGRTVLPYDYLPREDSVVSVEACEGKNALYYHALWIHKFGPSRGAQQHGVMYVDGQLAGVFGYDTYLTMGPGGAGGEWSDAVMLTFGASSPSRHRLSRLVTMICANRATIDLSMSPSIAVMANRIMTSEFTPYAESKRHRGVMTLNKREVQKNGTYRLVYEAPIVVEPYAEALARFLKREAKGAK